MAPQGPGPLSGQFEHGQHWFQQLLHQIGQKVPDGPGVRPPAGMPQEQVGQPAPRSLFGAPGRSYRSRARSAHLHPYAYSARASCELAIWQSSIRSQFPPPPPSYLSRPFEATGIPSSPEMTIDRFNALDAGWRWPSRPSGARPPRKWPCWPLRRGPAPPSIQVIPTSNTLSIKAFRGFGPFVRPANVSTAQPTSEPCQNPPPAALQLSISNF